MRSVTVIIPLAFLVQVHANAGHRAAPMTKLRGASVAPRLVQAKGQTVTQLGMAEALKRAQVRALTYEQKLMTSSFVSFHKQKLKPRFDFAEKWTTKHSEHEVVSRPVLAHEDMKDGGAAGALLMLGVTLLWGSNFPAVKATMEAGLPGSAAAAARFTIAAMALLPTLMDRASPLPPEFVRGGLACGVWIALGYISQAFALHDLPAGVVAFTVCLQVIFVPIVQTFRGSAFTPRLLLAACLCLCGTGLLESSGMSGATSDAPLVSAILFALLQPVGFGMGSMTIEALMKKFPNRSLQLTALQLLSNAAVALGWLALDAAGSGGTVDLSALQQPAVLGGLMYTGLISTALAVLLQTKALGMLPATDVSVIVATEPLWAAGFAAMFLGEHLTSGALAGGALILLGCLSNTLLPDDLGTTGKHRQKQAVL